ncbi:MAG: HipA family kinase [Bryobacteraceae bacterium]
MPLAARQWIRKMRGGAQAHLLVASDNHHYVVKCKQNPQHRRVLVNEWVSRTLLDYLGLPSPQTELIHLTEEFLAANPELTISVGSRTQPIAPGLHFGSRMPVDPNRFVIYDYLPDALLRQIANIRDFLGMLVFDKWVNNADSRQCVFFRAQVKEWLAQEYWPKKVAFVALMMDHGYTFGGPHWTLADSPLTGLYCRPLVYESVTGVASFEPWIERIRNFPPEVLDNAFKQVPEWWLNGDREPLENLLETLYRRRKRIDALVEDTRTGRVNPFPNWPL